MKYFLLILTIFIINCEEVNAGGVVNLDSLVIEALLNNPEINASKNRYLATTKRPSQEGTLPNPIIGGRIKNVSFDEITLGDDPRSDVQVFFIQEIPFPGKLSTKEKVAVENAESQKWLADAISKRIIADLKTAYFDWFFINKSIEITTKNKELLSKFAKVAEVKYEVGIGLQQDVLKAQVEVSRFIERLQLLNEKNQSIEYKIKKLLNRPLDSTLGKPEKVIKAEFVLNIDDISKITQEQAPLIHSSSEIVDSREESLNLAKKQYLPDFIIGGTYFNRSGGSGNFDDIWQLSLGLRVPLYFWKKERFGVEEANLNLLEAKENYDAVEDNLLFQVKDNFITAQTAEKLMKLYRGGIIPQSSLSLESAISGYQVGDVDFLTLLNNLITLFNFELEYYDQLTVYQKALVKIEELSGMEIISKATLTSDESEEINHTIGEDLNE